MLKLSLILCSDKIHQGGGVAAPIGSQVLGEVLPYLELQKDNQKPEDVIETVEVPEIRNMTLKEAEGKLKEIGLQIEYETKEGEEIDKTQIIVKEQTPKPGIKVNMNSKISVEF